MVILQKRMYLYENNGQSRLELARNMIKRPSDWGYTVFTDECSFWMSKSKLKKIWNKDTMQEEGLESHGPKMHVWGP